MAEAPAGSRAGAEAGGRARQATPRGTYLNEREYAHEGERATDAALKQMFRSPEYQQWLVANHNRMRMHEEEPDAGEDDDVGPRSPPGRS